VVPARHVFGTDADDDPLAGLASHRVAETLDRTRHAVLFVDGLQDVEDLLLARLERRPPADQEPLQLLVGPSALDEERTAGIPPEVTLVFKALVIIAVCLLQSPKTRALLRRTRPAPVREAVAAS